MGWIQVVDYWHWWIFGVVLVILEVFSPGVFFLWLGIAAGLVGLVLLVFPGLAWAYQILAFALFSLISVGVSQAYFKRHPIASEQPLLNRRGEQYVGRIFTLDDAIVNGQGKIRVDDSTWKIHGTDCPAATRVRVTGADGVVLRVEIVR
jgi:inner membrane protein